MKPKWYVRLWNRIISSELIPMVISVFTMMAIVSVLGVIITFCTKLILRMIGVI